MPALHKPRRCDLTDELQHKLFKLIAENPHISQRELSRALGISLGKANYCLKALIEKGWVKVQNFKNNKNKWGYLYLLTPSGIEEKARVTMRYLKRKMQEYDELKAAVAQLKREVEMEQRQLAKRGMVFTSHRQY